MTQTHDLTMERKFAAPPRAVYDAFLGMYGENRPDWIVESRLDLRPGGTWRVVFNPRGFPGAATRDDFDGGWSGVWDMLTPGEHDAGSAG
jgi:uncharacterized protein YndB with AHSA1/START domain